MCHRPSLYLDATACEVGALISKFIVELQPWQTKGCRTWVYVHLSCIGRGVAEKPSLSCSLLWLCGCAAAAAAWHPGSPGTAHGSANPQESPAVHCWCLPSIITSVWKSSGTEFMYSDNWHGQERHLSSVGQGFFQMALWEEVLYDGFLWKCFVNSEFPAV